MAQIDLNQLYGRAHPGTSRLIQAMDRERVRLGYRLHDSVAQSLVALRFQLVAIEGRKECSPRFIQDLGAVRESVGEVLEEVVTLSLQVHARIVDDLGLLAALRQLSGTRPSGLNVVFQSCIRDASEFRHMQVEASRALYQLVQEAIDNAERHAAATSLTMTLDVAHRVVSLNIADNGRGFDTALLMEPVVSTGLLLTTQRLAMAGGTLLLRSEPNGGTVVEAHVPY